MFRPRVIPTLLLSNDGLVKTQQFSKPKYVGDPINAVKLFNEFQADELVFLDIEASLKNQPIRHNIIKQIAEEAYMPFSYGGGIDSLEKASKVINEGAEKVIINSANYDNPHLLKEVSDLFGSSSVVAAIDVIKVDEEYALSSHSNTKIYNTNILEYCLELENRGAGELMINSIHKDGMESGYDIYILDLISRNVGIPVIASGGARNVYELNEVYKKTDVSAFSIGSHFVFVGINRAVMINYPYREELKQIFSDNVMKDG